MLQQVVPPKGTFDDSFASRRRRCFGDCVLVGIEEATFTRYAVRSVVTDLARPAAVLFDVGDTLLEERWFDLDAGIAAVSPDRSLADAFRVEIARCHAKQTEALLARWLQHRVPELAARSIDAIEDAIWSAVVELVPMPHVREALERLAGEGVALAAISNAPFSGRLLGAELARHGLAKHLQFVISSGDVGTRKPAPGIYELALNRLGVPARRAWFVGDTEPEDLIGAEAVGLIPVLFDALARGSPSAHSRRVVHSWPDFLELFAATNSNAGGSP